MVKGNLRYVYSQVHKDRRKLARDRVNGNCGGLLFRSYSLPTGPDEKTLGMGKLVAAQM